VDVSETVVDVSDQQARSLIAAAVGSGRVNTSRRGEISRETTANPEIKTSLAITRMRARVMARRRKRGASKSARGAVLRASARLVYLVNHGCAGQLRVGR